jgi:hypothetical protein
MRESILRPLSLSFAAVLCMSLLAGCAANFQPNPLQTEQSSIGNIQGLVHGGQSPISGAQIYLFSAGTGGYASAPTSLLTKGGTGSNTVLATSGPFTGDYYVTTDSGGNFSLWGDYTCTAGTQVYMVAYGGNPGFAASGTFNTAIMQMAGLGQCPSTGTMAQQVPYLTINEISTAVFAYAMGGFGTSAANVGSAATTQSETGIANAMANVTNILNIQWGQSPAKTNGTTAGTVPVSKIYTLANILGACVNTTSNTSTQCSTLFTNTGNSTNEAQAIFYIVHHPTTNVTALYNLQPTTPAFSPNLGTAPTDWTLPIVYTGVISTYGTNGTTIDSGPFNIASDAQGNLWVGDEQLGVVEIGPQGANTAYNKNANGAAFGEIKGVAVSPTGVIWASDSGSNEMNILSSAGTATLTTAAGLSGIDGPAMIAFDNSGNAWVANDLGNSLSRFTSAGAAYNGNTTAYGFSGRGVDEPAWVALDSNLNAFLPSQASAYLGALASTATRGVVSSVANGGDDAGYAMAVDSSNNLWVPTDAATGPWTLNEVGCSSTTTANDCTVNATFNNNGGMNIPDRIALDGGGTLWIANQGAATVSAYNITSGWLAANGFTTGTTGTCLDAVPDISGNIWTANKDGTVTQLLGIATPTAMPLIPSNYEKKP